jgi:hypothetical protein
MQPLLAEAGWRLRYPLDEVMPVGAKYELTHSRPATALALYDLVALLQQALALAILALLLLLDVGAFLTCHDVLRTAVR